MTSSVIYYSTEYEIYLLICLVRIIHLLQRFSLINQNKNVLPYPFNDFHSSYLYKPTGACWAASSDPPSFASLMSLGLPTFSKKLCAFGESSPDSVGRNIYSSYFCA